MRCINPLVCDGASVLCALEASEEISLVCSKLLRSEIFRRQRRTKKGAWGRLLLCGHHMFLESVITDIFHRFICG